MKIGALGRVALSVAALMASTSCLAQTEHLPLRNLLVEMRQSQDDATTEQQAATGTGSVTIHSDGRIVGGITPGTVTTKSREASRPSLQQLQVLNGGRGSMRLAHAEPLQFFQVTLTPRGLEATPATVWQETGTGFTVHPRWPGGTQPVTVELTAEAGEARLLTTLRLPLGEWVTIARAAQSDASIHSGSVSAQQIESASGFALQMRVSAPR